MHACFVFVCIDKLTWIYFPIFLRDASLAQGQMHSCPYVSEVTLEDMGKIDVTNQNKIQSENRMHTSKWRYMSVKVSQIP